MKKILIASIVGTKKEVVSPFLQSVEKLVTLSCTIDYFFYDYQLHEDSKKELALFAEQYENTILRMSNNDDRADEGQVHEWKMARLKNIILDYARDHHYDHLLLVDADVVLHPYTVEQLLCNDQDIVCTLCWTRWQEGECERPQVWLEDDGRQYQLDQGSMPTREKQAHLTQSFMEQMKKPGVYEVGGVAKCTLLSRKVLLSEVRYTKIPSLSFRDPERHFAIRAVVHNFKLYADTHFPVFHLYNQLKIADLSRYLEWCQRTVENLSPVKQIQVRRKIRDNRLIAVMQVRNEADRYLEQVLHSITPVVDEIVIVDDASTDDTVSICRSFDKVKKVVELSTSSFQEEWKLRQLVWETACDCKPDWILVIDADEIYEEQALHKLRELINQGEYDWYGFQFYDFWDGYTHYRQDHLWRSPHVKVTLVRYIPELAYTFPQMNHHVPKIPLIYQQLPGKVTDLRVKHLGWAGDEKERYQKYLRYLEMDPEGKYGSMAQYQSILDKNPRLVEWKE
ncbi:glycosyltransferase [Mechercharimyces sp. CAU 1602]|uniref:glycosyltransferase n=1 Tax=Mechercharimyces sp. CAU 1602 TaxID=2973933 RepID=UPI002161FB63|nr:glycosyltransferase [Mechercharimyces sp. CAU 1602]MCS1351934.1 glycosyltransferase [Mechercharimyces sp. CAU 1602]